MQILSSNLLELKQRITAFEKQYARIPTSVRLLAVSKQQSAEAISAIHALGQKDFGENYLQEALSKIDALKNKDICWHFIGHIQSNKTPLIAQHFDWVHSVDRLKIATRLNEQRPIGLIPLNICLQINIDEETTKSGISINELTDIAHAIRELPNIKLRGLMCIPAKQATLIDQRNSFAKLKNAYNNLVSQGFSLDTLSMGMSQDMEAAIAEGSTLIRIGTAIFGPRK